jgi:hypothetical protein
MLIDPGKGCELCSGPLVMGSETGICRSNARCMQENDDRVRASITDCKICGAPLGSRNRIGICRTNDKCCKEAKKIHDRQYHQSRASHQSRAKPREIREPKQEAENNLLPEDGILDTIAIRIAANGLRKVRLTHRERVEVVKRMLNLGAGVRDMCDNIHVSPGVVRDILDELGFECIRNTHIVGSKIMIILPKNRPRRTGQ